MAETSVLLFLLYFGQGLPYGFQVKLLPLLLRKQSFSLSRVGFSRLLSLPWIFKFTIAPFIDNFWSLDLWILFGSLAMALLCFISAIVGFGNIHSLLICVFLMNLTSAVQDVAVDTFAISLLKPSDLAIGSTLQVVGYKMGALFGGGLLAWLSVFFSWEWLFGLWGSFYVVLLILVVIIFQHALQHIKSDNLRCSTNTTINDLASVDGAARNEGINCEHNKESQKNQATFPSTRKATQLNVAQILKNILHTSDFVWLVCCVLTYKLGEQGVVSMFPLFLMDQGFPHDQVGAMSGIFGQAFSIVGSTIGGWIIGMHYGQRSWVLKVLLCTSYARLLPLSLIWLFSSMPLSKLWFNVLLECSLQLSGGIMTTATFTLMMLSSQNSSPGTKASHLALLATVEVLGKLFMISSSGFLVDNVGYQCFFGLCFALALFVIPVLRNGIASSSKKSL